MQIDEAIDKLIGIEGGYVNNPNDKGGETNWGITVDTARRHGYTGPMIALPRDEAARIYKQEYITDPKLDQIWTINDQIAYELFDSGVNLGPGTAIKWLQIGLNALNREGKDYTDGGVDGAIGPHTCQALTSYMEKRGADGVIVLLKILNVLQGAHYLDLAQQRQQDEEFIFGWFRTRVELPGQ